ncbi:MULTISPECIES: response regulator [Marinobacter]|uniref:Response regulator n=1 Tax=Marinobacter profundi TaxID=2666256 RepID=A0A2G1ULF5_9GAMM|nr:MULTISPECIES: response regulator [Marinobacter]MBD3658376.1 response regulator [Marinobacter sp.]PHQ15334.1 response regulator [Marinobacter profundi]
MIKIQLVDDEANILSALKRLLRPQGWEIHGFTDVEEALGSLREHNYAVIISDYQMPTADGVTYLQFAKQRQPDAVRLVLSAHGDRNSMIKAINQAEVYRFLSKPWDEHEIVAAIKSAIDLHLLRAENRHLLKQVQHQQTLIRAREQELLRLEQENPGITRVMRDDDGSVLLDDDEPR